MKLFLSQTAAPNSESLEDHFCKVLEMFANYIRAPHRNTVDIIVATEKELKAMNIE